MACLEHYCTNPHCTWWTADNERGPATCPVCGDRAITQFDETREEHADYGDDVDVDGDEPEDDAA